MENRTLFGYAAIICLNTNLWVSIFVAAFGECALAATSGISAGGTALARGQTRINLYIN